MSAAPENAVLVGDCIAHMEAMPAGFVDLVATDPPYNVSYKYDVYDDDRPKEDYLAWTERWLAAVKRVLKADGSLFVVIGDEYAAEVKVRLDALGLTMRNWIVWHYTFGVACRKKFSRSHAHILYYVASAKHFTFEADAVRVPSARQTEYGDKRAAKGGKLPDDTWVLRPQEEERCFRPEGDTWHVPRVCGTFGERTGHPCQMPQALLERIVRVASRPGDLVFDPFAGSGTTLAAAKRLGRRYLGCELSEKYAEAVRERLATVEEAAPPPEQPSLFGPEDS